MIIDDQQPDGPVREAATALDFRTIAKDIPCQEACPAKTNVPEYIRLIAEGKPAEAHRINQACNVLPGVLGRICTRPCEDRCRHQWTNTRGPVRICHLKRSAADAKAGVSRPLPAYAPPTDKRVAIVGGGPAGLAAGRELARLGHAVTLLEREQVLGGQARYGVPAFRLPVAVIEEDIQAIVDQGLELRLGQAVDADTVTGLLADYDAVLVATGANRPRRLDLPGLDTGQAIEGLGFMRAYNLGEPLSVTGDVLIIGGGFTAVDCARSARRLVDPAARVTICYRRSEAEMAANREELHELRREGIAIETLASPAAVRLEAGRLTGVTFTRNVLGAPDPDGRPSFHAVPDSAFSRPCGTLIYAIGQTAETEILPAGVATTEGHTTARAGLFLAGDFALGNGDVIHAVADGKAAAVAIDSFLMGRARLGTVVAIRDLRGREFLGRTRDDDLLEAPAMPVRALEARDRDAEVELGFDDALAGQHAWRCYQCNHKFEIDQDRCIHCDWCIKAAPRHCIRRLSHLELDADGAAVSWTEVPASQPEKATYIWIDSDACIRCGKCLRACPVGAISLRKADLVQRIPSV